MSPASVDLLREAQASAESLVEVLLRRATFEPETEMLFYSAEGDPIEDRLSVARLDRRARALAHVLAGQAERGARAMLFFKPGLEFVEALFGCLYAGLIAVPTYPPRMVRGELEKKSVRARLLAEDATPTVLLADRTSEEAVRRAFPGPTPIIVPSAVPDAPFEPTIPGRDEVAVIQYTSGSTSAPKGVMLTHGQLLANSRTIHAAFQHSPAARGVLWLPHEHDMGLVGSILQSIFGAGPALLMSPMAFLQDPMSWLRAISRFGATTAGGPNFAYQLLADRAEPEDLVGLDLSRWEVAFVGAEPVRAQTLEAFQRKFEPVGFRATSFVPCYGLAESTLMVTSCQKGRGPRVLTVSAQALERGAIEPSAEGRRLVSSGTPVDSRVSIRPIGDSALLPDGRIGEVCVEGPSIAQGYLGRPTDPAFEGRLLRTGDLGFLYEGELYVTGRHKDVVIVDGANHYAEDLEATIDACHEELRRSSGAVFGVETRETEGVVVVWETRRPRTKAAPAEIQRAIRAAVAEWHGLSLVDVVLTAPGGVARTESGKIRRQECRRAYLAGELPGGLQNARKPKDS
ncbi:MAG: fatty acyl-AMP ligase [Myxococcota bacterium]